MTDDPPWLADAVEAACRAFCYAEGECPCATSAECGRWWHVSVDMRAALAAFLRAVPNVSVMQARAPGQWHTTRTLAAAIERLGAPEKPDAQ